MHRRNNTSISLDEFRKIVETELTSRGHQADIDQILDEILNRSGLVRIIESIVEFRHHLLQEFFAGRGIPSPDLLQNYVLNDWWRRAIVFYFGDRPGEFRNFDTLLKALVSATPDEMYAAAICIGLSLQACYLLHLDEKVKIYPWVVTRLAQAARSFETAPELENKPLTAFLAYYLIARDSVACEILRERFDQIFENLSAANLTKEEKDAVVFWLIIGLIEIGEFNLAKQILKKSRPADIRFLLCIHCGCGLIEHLRVATREERKDAAEISHSLSSIISPLREKLIQEFKSHLLEIRQGKIYGGNVPAQIPEQAQE